jgi:N-dimethylarginine dimethylaminohydrolase
LNYHLKGESTDQTALVQNAHVHGRARILMCPPDHFGVDYVINPWMENQIGRADLRVARAQWHNLSRGLAASAALDFVAPAEGLPDMVFTANAGLVIGDTVALARFQAKERRPEESLFRDWFEARGYKIASWPEEIAFEGAGDALPDRAQPLIWCGYGWRSHARAAGRLADIFGREAVGLRLIDPRFYHLDTCLCPLSGGWLMYYPAAFDEASRGEIAARVPAERRIEVGEADAMGFACNAVEAGGFVFMNACSPALRAHLAAAGFQPVVTPLSEFLKAGGGAKCLTLEVGPAAYSEQTARRPVRSSVS